MKHAASLVGEHEKGEEDLIADRRLDCFTVIDVSDPTDPELVSTHGVYGDGITRGGDVAYLTGSSGYFFAFDISTPGAPVQLGLVDAIESHDVYVDSGVAFVTNSSGHGVNVVNVSDPANMC